MKRTSLFISIFALLFLFVSCAKEEEDISEKQAEHEDHDHDVVSLTKDQINEIDLKTAKVLKKPFGKSISLKGQISVPPNHRAVVSPYLTVFITEIKVISGDAVKKGQIVARASSPEFIALQRSYLMITSRLDELEQEYDRQVALAADSITARKNLQMAASEFRQAKAEKASLAKKLALMDVNLSKLEQGNIRTVVNLKSPIDGNISNIKTVVGKHVEPHEEVLEIINEEHIHLELNVYEADIEKVKEGQKVYYSLKSDKSVLYEAEIFKISKFLNQEGRFTQVHAHLHTSPEMLLPGMYLNASIITESDSAWVFPSTALVRDAGQNFIYFLEKKEQEEWLFRRQRLQNVMTSDFLLGVKDLQKGSEKKEVVVDGSWYLENVLNETGGHHH